METATETAPEAPVAEAAPEVVSAAPEAAPAPEAKPFDPKTIPSEIREYFTKQQAESEKKYADYEKHQRSSQEWESVKRDPRFGDWVKSLNAPAAPKAFEISDDQFTAALTDKGQFARLVQDAAKHLLETQVGPQLQQTQQRFQFQEKVAEVQETAKKYPDFMALDKQGLIEPIIQKYPNLSFEDAYWLAKRKNFSAEVDAKARGVVHQKKTASVEKGATPPGARTPKVKAKNREEAMTMVMEAARAGREIPEFDEIGD